MILPASVSGNHLENEVQKSPVSTQDKVDQDDKVEAAEVESVTEDTKKSEHKGRGRGRGNKSDADGKPVLR